MSVVCSQCGKLTEKVPCRAAMSRTYCSPECGRAAIRAASSTRMRARLAAGYVPPPMTWNVHHNVDGFAVKLRSKWERDFARWCDAHGLFWEYEPTRTDVGGRPYTPDFLVTTPFGQCFVEVHRMEEDLKPGDDAKVARIREVECSGLAGYPLVVIGSKDIYRMQKELRRRTLHDADEALEDAVDARAGEGASEGERVRVAAGLAGGDR